MVFIIALIIIAAAGYPAKPEPLPQCTDLKLWYDQYNEAYFLGALPNNTVVDYSNNNEDSLASTFKEGNHFHIAFNPKYAGSARVAHAFLPHEMCHVLTWSEDIEHGPRWKSCMYDVVQRGAIIDQMVGAY